MEQAEAGDASALHVIVFDEIDAFAGSLINELPRIEQLEHLEIWHHSDRRWRGMGLIPLVPP